MGKRIFLLDGSAIAYRSHFAFGSNPLTTEDGMDTSACYGFAQTLLRIRQEENPDFLAVVFDSKEPTFRHKKFPEYKATREKMPEELQEQLPWIQEMVEAMNIPFIKKAGLEADDIIGTLAYQSQGKGMEVYMVTGDKDFMQLLKPNIYMYNLKKRSALDILNETAPEKKWGVPVENVTDMLALMGDTSDNIPGIPGIGEKTAAKLIQAYGGLDQIYQNIEHVEPERIAKKLKEYKDLAYLCKELVTIKTDAKLSVDFDDLRVEDFDNDRLKKVFERLQFGSILKKLNLSSAKSSVHSGKKFSSTPKAKATSEVSYTRIETEKDLKNLIKDIQKAKTVAVDTETTGLDPIGVHVLGVSFCFKAHQAFYVSFAHLDVAPKDAWNHLRVVLEDASIAKVGQNIKYDRHVLFNEGVELKGIGFDTMIASYLLSPNTRAHGLDALALEHLEYEKTPTEALIGKGAKQISMRDVDIHKVTQYACEDADVTWQLYELFLPQLQDQGLMHVFEDIEMPLLEVLGDMERTGITLDTKALKTQSVELQKQVQKLEKDIIKLAGKSFNIRSPKQLGPILFEDLKIQDHCNVKKVKKTKTGYATDQETLEKYLDHPIVEKILSYRNLTKLISTYIDALPTLIHEATGKIHTSFNQTVAATGRLSSSDPNLQNIPIRSDEGKRIRKAFIASEKNWKILSADYSQIELRLLAHLSEDPTMIDMFQSGKDIHQQTASKIFHVDLDEVSPQQRSNAKTINFGIIYGMGPQRLSRENNVSLEEAKAFIENYFETFSHVQQYFDDVIQHAQKDGYVTTITGRKRPVDLQTSNPRFKSMAERIAMNTPLQGSAADLIKIAMLHVQQELTSSKWDARLLIQVHDELILEAPAKEIESLQTMIQDKMSHAFELRVPLVVDVGVGDNWADAH